MKLSIVAIAAGAFYALASAAAPPAYANPNYCTMSNRATVVFIDQTTRYDETDRRILAQGLNRAFAGLQTGDRFILRTITAEYGASETVYDACRPGCTAENSGLFGACRPMQAETDLRRVRAQFIARARQVVDNADDAAGSDIMMTIATATAEIRDRRLTHVLVFSDMLENSRTYRWPSVLSTSPSAFVERARLLNAVPSVRGAEVRVFGFGRGHGAERRSLAPDDRRSLLAAWSAYFRAGGAATVTIDQNIS